MTKRNGFKALATAVIVGAMVATAVGGVANASTYLTHLGKGTNDGVFALTAAQDSYLGVSCTGTCQVGFYRVRGSTIGASLGDYFDANSVLASMQTAAMQAGILGIFNGPGANGTGGVGLTYTGGVWDPLGTTTLSSATDAYAAVAIVWDSAVLSSIVFNNPNCCSTFANSSTLQSVANNPQLAPTPTPLPATLPLFASGLGALGLLGWRRKRKAKAAA